MAQQGVELQKGQIYKCIRHHPNLTKGGEYQELMPNPNAFNACVRDNENNIVYLARSTYFAFERDV